MTYLIYTMQNSPRGTPQAHSNDLAPVKYPTGVTDSSHKYFSWHALPKQSYLLSDFEIKISTLHEWKDVMESAFSKTILHDKYPEIWMN
jgi:hypothetical protein